jgi:hypothetical protein
MTTPPPGWYDDGRGTVRWWDGANWTDHVAAPPVEQGVDQPTAETVPLAPADQMVDQPTAETERLDPLDPAPPGPVPPYVASEYATSAYAPAGHPASGYAASSLDPQTGAVMAPAEPRKSRLWILWVALGALLVAVVIALIVLSPLLWSGLVAGGDPSSAPSSVPSAVATPPTEESSAGSAGSTPTEADKQAAVATVERHNDAWLTADCDGFMATTTESLREYMEITDCAAFTVESRNFAGSVDGYVTTINDVEVVGDAVAVSTSETYTSRFDAEGNQTDETLEYEDRYEYIVVPVDGAWVIDDFFAE